MANFLQKLFRPEYQWQLLDMVKSHDIEYIKTQRDTWLNLPHARPISGTIYSQTYIIKTQDTLVSVQEYTNTTNPYKIPARPAIEYTLRVERYRQPGDKRTYKHEETDTNFAYKMFKKMQNKYLSEREFSW